MTGEMIYSFQVSTSVPSLKLVATFTLMPRGIWWLGLITWHSAPPQCYCAIGGRVLTEELCYCGHIRRWQLSLTLNPHLSSSEDFSFVAIVKWICCYSYCYLSLFSARSHDVLVDKKRFHYTTKKAPQRETTTCSSLWSVERAFCARA